MYCRVACENEVSHHKHTSTEMATPDEDTHTGVQLVDTI